MNIAIRLFIGYFIIVGLSAWFMMSFVFDAGAPVLRQATEETLVDVANLMAEMVSLELSTGDVSDGQLAQAVKSALERSPSAHIWGVHKSTVDLRVYVTDAAGIVVFDSESKDVGANYSRWRDVALTLKGEYGARTSRDNPDEEISSVMYIGAPVVHEGKLIGVLTVGKPSRTLQPYLENAFGQITRMGMLILVFSAAVGLVFTWWLTWSLNRLRDYAHALAGGKKATPPTGGGHQLTELAQALTLMRERLDGKQYVEKYVQSLTHELKSPLSAIRGAAELLRDMPSEKDRARFVNNIEEQSARMQAIIDRLLTLARIEQLQAPEAMKTAPIETLIGDTLESRQERMRQREITVRLSGATDGNVTGDLFLLQQALGNILDNAIDFSPVGGTLEITVETDADDTTITLRDHGPGAPSYALPHVFERFYSLPRAQNGRKSTGLGLAFVMEVMRIHGGSAAFANHPEGGASVSLRLPR